jgi:phosphoribosylanthranilate isomerase
MIVQIYEIQTPQEAEKCIELGVDHLGSVLIGLEQWEQPVIRETINVSKGTQAKSSLIPLFQGLDPLSRVLEYYQPDYIHFCETLTSDHGRPVELEPYIRLQQKLKERFPNTKIMRSIPIPLSGFKRDFPTLRIAKDLEKVSDFFLTDTWLGKEPVEGFIGITGKRCDPKIAKNLVKQSRIPVILAGGLSPENVYEAVLDIQPAGADSCTQTNETDENDSPLRFRKDYDKVRRFVDEVRRAERK